MAKSNPQTNRENKFHAPKLADMHLNGATQDEQEPLRVFVADVAPKQLPVELYVDRMTELTSLVETYGGVVILQTIQKKDNPDYHSYLGKGKLEEVVAGMIEMHANLLIIGNILKPSQLYTINEMLRPHGMQAWDRVDLILKIFDKHAEGAEARLQIELASLKHMWPRIYDMSMELGRQGAGKGSKGQGETNTEVMKRHLKQRIMDIEIKLKEFERTRGLHRESRRKKWLLTLGLVGYTNAGKSSLLNSLTGKGVLAANKLFATLGTSVGKLRLQKSETDYKGYEFLVNDTIGFIRDLPPKLVRAFRSTLEDSIESDLLLHVVDAADPRVGDKIKVVDSILKQIGAKQDRITIFNKVDLVGPERLAELKVEFAGLDPVWISTESGEGLEELKREIVRRVG